MNLTQPEMNEGNIPTETAERSVAENTAPEQTSMFPILVVVLIIIAGGWYVLIENRPERSPVSDVTEEVSDQEASAVFEEEASSIDNELAETEAELEALEQELGELDLDF